jgi:hypothetical protein
MVGCRPQLVVVSNLLVGIPLTVGFRPQLVVVSGLSVGIPLTVGFYAFTKPFTITKPFRKLFLFHDEISAITEPFHVFFFHTLEFCLSQRLLMNLSFSRWNLGYHRAFSRILLSQMESRLSWSLLMNFSFSRWNLSYYVAFSRILLSHDGISAITEPFHNFFFLTMESRLSRTLFTNSSFTR